MEPIVSLLGSLIQDSIHTVFGWFESNGVQLEVALEQEVVPAPQRRSETAGGGSDVSHESYFPGLGA